jgi:hypothetical protein
MLRRELLIAGGVAATVFAATVAALWAWSAATPPGEPCCGGPIGPRGVGLGGPTEESRGGQYWYNVTIASANGEEVLGDLSFSVTDASGSVVSPAEWSLQLQNVTGVVVGVYAFSTAGWSSGAQVPLISEDVIVFETHGPLTGDVFVLHDSSDGYSTPVYLR